MKGSELIMATLMETTARKLSKEAFSLLANEAPVATTPVSGTHMTARQTKREKHEQRLDDALLADNEQNAEHSGRAWW